MKDFNSQMLAKYGNNFLPTNWLYKKARSASKSLIYGIGINDVEFVTKPTVDSVRLVHPAYSIWEAMLNRCYGTTSKTNINYSEITCCVDWFSFSNFLLWWLENYTLGYQLDKDLLIKDNKVYSPNTCIFAPAFINSFVTLRKNDRGNYPIGVSLVSVNRYRAAIGSDKKYLGVFDTPEGAHRAWQRAKLEQAIAFNFPPLQRVIDQLKFDIENNLETTSL